uniref:Uncharacterized protein n=1 Tax=Candidatus Kentrum sp. DK TaxID=2126562 RepID=A0A450TNA8_9GAMM|nr:MAG: hypothetical protein BECKDK2373B_GA0170837_12382 [Candidatus Kentron sp. DK]
MPILSDTFDYPRSRIETHTRHWREKMHTAEILFDTFLKKIVDDGMVTSEEEAEQAIFSMLEERELDRKIAIAQEQVRNGQYTEMNDGFMEDFLKEAEARNAHIFKDDR